MKGPQDWYTVITLSTFQELLNKHNSPFRLTEEGSSLEYGCAWHQLMTLRKNLGRRGWGDYWCFLASSSCCSYCPTVLCEQVLSQTTNAIRLLNYLSESTSRLAGLLEVAGLWGSVLQIVVVVSSSSSNDHDMVVIIIIVVVIIISTTIIKTYLRHQG